MTDRKLIYLFSGVQSFGMLALLAGYLWSQYISHPDLSDRPYQIHLQEQNVGVDAFPLISAIYMQQVRLDKIATEVLGPKPTPDSFAVGGYRVVDERGRFIKTEPIAWAQPDRTLN